MIRALAILFLIGSLSACSPREIGKAALGAAVGSGPSVNANAQVGQKNSQTIGTSRAVEIAGPLVRESEIENLTQNTEQDASENQVKADRVETVVVHQVPTWLLAGMAIVILSVLVIAYLAPSPRWFRR